MAVLLTCALLFGSVICLGMATIGGWQSWPYFVAGFAVSVVAFAAACWRATR